MTQVSSLPSSTADVNDMYHDKRLPKGIHVVWTDEKSAQKVEGMSISEETEAPWGYLFIQHFAAEISTKISRTVALREVLRPSVLFTAP